MHNGYVERGEAKEAEEPPGITTSGITTCGVPFTDQWTSGREYGQRNPLFCDDKHPCGVG